MLALLCLYIVQRLSVGDVIPGMVWNGMGYSASNFGS